MIQTGYYKVMYYGTWMVMEYVNSGTITNPRFHWVGTHNGATIVASDYDLFEIGEKITF